MKLSKRELKRRQNLKRWREKVPEPMIEVRAAGIKAADQMAKHHVDILQNIEFVLVRCFHNDERIDDSRVFDALSVATSGRPADDSCVQQIVECLAETRQTRNDVSDELWQKGLRVIMGSVKRHTSGRPGATEYLEFVSEYVR